MRELDGIGHHGSAYANNLSAEQTAGYTAAFSAITERFKQAQLDGLSVSGEIVQQLVQQERQLVQHCQLA